MIRAGERQPKQRTGLGYVLAKKSCRGSGNNNNPRRGLFGIGQGPFSFRIPHTQEPQQGRSDFTVPTYGQSQAGWPVNQGQGHQQQFSPDPRFGGQQQQSSFASYPSRASPNMFQDLHDSRTLPPLNMPQTQVHPGTQHLSMAGGHVRSPSNAGYSAAYAPFPPHQQPSAGYSYPAAPDPRNLPPPISPMTYDLPSGVIPGRRTSMSVDRTRAKYDPRIRAGTRCGAYDQEERKRADAEQLKVLNETYNRTAFPSTEERVELAKKLGMSARSVQIWFQNKRQAMRQSTRHAATSAPPTTNEPFPTSSHTPAPAPLPAPGYGMHAPMGPSSISQGYAPRPGGDIPLLHHPSGRLIPSPIHPPTIVPEATRKKKKTCVDTLDHIDRGLLSLYLPGP
ncbi:Homeobox protein HD-10 [Grifola frondosa]|uniref:Homeobox protein HD-10 n=1 Tax=Grifola frondosa TaxID=5627 RepID=A0A1C7LUX5_GRIFR|nr:Homeobox protein HD-10 [Grifola frondosa]